MAEQEIIASKNHESKDKTIALQDVMDAKEASTNRNGNNFFSRNSSAIQAICALATVLITICLAVFAYFSLERVKEQNELAFKQFVVANLPSISILAGSTKPEISDDKFMLVWQVMNLGGPVNLKQESRQFFWLAPGSRVNH